MPHCFCEVVTRPAIANVAAAIVYRRSSIETTSQNLFNRMRQYGLHICILRVEYMAAHLASSGPLYSISALVTSNERPMNAWLSGSIWLPLSSVGRNAQCARHHPIMFATFQTKVNEPMVRNSNKAYERRLRDDRYTCPG